MITRRGVTDIRSDAGESPTAGGYVVPWKRCAICRGPNDDIGPFRSPRDFCRHLRDYHCTREGGSFVCRYGLNNVCPSLPVDGVSDRDYEDHVARDHVAGESVATSPTGMIYTQHSDLKNFAAATMPGGVQPPQQQPSSSSSSSQSRSPTPASSSMLDTAPSVVRDQHQWTIYMSRVNLPAVLNDPTLAWRETDFFTKTWGEDFEKTDVRPSPFVPHVTADDFRKYLSRTSTRHKKHLRFAKSFSTAGTTEDAILKEKEFPALHARKLSKLHAELDVIPKIFQQSGFSLQNPETFNAVIPWSQVAASRPEKASTPAGAGAKGHSQVQGQGQQSSKLLQEKLSHYLDIVEIQIAEQISRRSEAFFDAMISHDELQDHMKKTCDVIRYLREKVRHLDHIHVENPLRILQLKMSCSNHMAVYDKLKLMATVHQTQPNIQMLLANSDYVGALDLIAATQDILTRELAGIQSFRHLSSQLLELEKMIDHMMHEEFIRFATLDLNRPVSEQRSPTDEERLIMIVLGALRQHKYEFIDIYKDESSTALKAVVKQTVIEAVAAADDIDGDGGMPGLANQMRMLNYSQWMSLLTSLFSSLLAILGRVRSFTKIVHDIIKSSCEPDALGIECQCPLPAAVTSTDGDGAALHENVERRISMTTDSEQLLSQGEYLRVAGLLHEMLAYICEHAHDRCQKVLAARAKDGFLERLSSSEFVQLSWAIEDFIATTEQISGRRSTGLRASLQSQASKYIGRFHEERKTKLGLILDNERWKQADVPLEFQELVDHISTSGQLSLPAKKPEMDKQPVEFLLVDGEQYAVVGTILILLKIVVEYCQLTNDIPSTTPEVLNRLVELLKTFNSRTCQLILGAGALHLVGLKNINTKNLGLASRCLQLVVHYLPMLRRHFEERLNGKQLNMLKHFDHLLKDYMDHITEISNKLVAIMDSMLEMNLAKVIWEVKAPMPSACFRSIARQIAKLHEAVHGLLPQKQIQELFLMLHDSFKRTLRAQLKKLGVTRDGGPQHGLVMSDIAFYTSSLRSLPGLSNLNVNVDDIWDRR